MACGVPAVATRVGGIVDIETHGVDGLLVEAGDERAFETALLNLMMDSSLRKEMGDRARRSVIERFSEEEVIGRFEELFVSRIEQHTVDVE
jgi:glycosyltransferase involved in cell wall biosynthesis